MLKFKKGDKIIIITGKFKGKKGIINKILYNENYVYIKGINYIKKYIKNNKIIKGSKLIKPYKINISNIAILDPILNKRTRIGFKFIKSKKKRVCKKSDTILN
ncbi:MAG: 50S ribosomal protein L24 [Candidatus Shikimatogenerans sp. JK-2022]|nr:50S ribosomal protein L24 [Candidatus Shikimatogenerans bostrichidophilus]